MKEVAIGLGSSLGEPLAQLRMAVYGIDAFSRTRVVRCSRVVASPPLLGVATGSFHNAVVRAHTELGPLELLDALRTLECRLGRRPTRRWGDRVIDLDLLLYGDERITHARLRVPHPRMVERPFVLGPLAEAWPEARNPWTGLLYRDTLPVRDPLPVVGTLPQPDVASRGGAV